MHAERDTTDVVASVGMVQMHQELVQPHPLYTDFKLSSGVEGSTPASSLETS